MLHFSWLDGVPKMTDGVVMMPADPSYMLQLEDQNGNAVQFLSPEDKHALVTGLVLHASGQACLEKVRYLSPASQPLCWG